MYEERFRFSRSNHKRSSPRLVVRGHTREVIDGESNVAIDERIAAVRLGHPSESEVRRIGMSVKLNSEQPHPKGGVSKGTAVCGRK